MSFGMGFRNKQTGLGFVKHGIRASDPILKTVTPGSITIFNQTLTLRKIYHGDEDTPLDWNLNMSFEISILQRERREVEFSFTLSSDEKRLATISG